MDIMIIDIRPAASNSSIPLNADFGVIDPQADKVVAEKETPRLGQDAVSPPGGTSFSADRERESAHTTLDEDRRSKQEAIESFQPLATTMRFNYQQRVGRAGRRGAPMSMALTLCRGRSHDDYYFQRPERITADPPPAPYVDTSRPQILQRVLAKEVLRRAFSELGLFSTNAGDSVHGEFGHAMAWLQAPANQPTGYAGATTADIIQEWIDNHVADIASICNTLLAATRLVGDAPRCAEIIRWIHSNLVQEITQATADPALIQDALSERLATCGILPMFGFPTRARLLYHRFPQSWPTRDVVDRDLELAVSMFAPGAETVKERTIHTAIGVAHYRRQGPSVVEDNNPLDHAQ